MTPNEFGALGIQPKSTGAIDPDPQVVTLLDQALRASLRRCFILAPQAVAGLLVIFWIVDAVWAGAAFGSLVFAGAGLHWLVSTDRLPIRSVWLIVGYGSWAASIGLLPVLFIPATVHGQYALLLATVVAMPLMSFGLSASARAFSVWLLALSLTSVVVWSIVDTLLPSAFPQATLVAAAILSFSLAREALLGQRTLARASVQARNSSQIDKLTGLYRRTAFVEKVERSLRSNPQASLFFIDINRFKVINDTLGHRAGDQLLSAVAGRVVCALRESDFAGRMGGDEIAIFVADASRDVALDIAGRLHRLFERDFQLLQHRVPVEATIGMVCAEGNVNAAKLVHQADTAMYAAKRDGRPIRLFDEKMHADLLRLEETELDLRTSLRRGEICAYLQPIVDVAKGEIAGFEALGRWQRNGRIVAAADFFLSAEQSNLLPAITRAVAQDLIDFSLSVAPATPPMFGVNVEAGDLGSFLDWVARQPIDPTRWVVELTEHQIVDNYTEANREVRRAAAMGLSVVLDDFGKGYSSLNRILRLPITGLKIDATFVAEMQQNETARAIVSSAVHLATECDLIVIAEGVETQEQADALAEMGVCLMQGYHFHRPASIADSMAIVASERSASERSAIVPTGAAVGPQTQLWVAEPCSL